MRTFTASAREDDAPSSASVIIALPEPVSPPPGKVTVTMSTALAQVLVRVLGKTNGSLTGGLHSALMKSLQDAGFVPYAHPNVKLNQAFDLIDIVELEKSLAAKA